MSEFVNRKCLSRGFFIYFLTSSNIALKFFGKNVIFIHPFRNTDGIGFDPPLDSTELLD